MTGVTSQALKNVTEKTPAEASDGFEKQAEMMRT